MPLQPEALTWTALLSQWVKFAQASAALPKDASGERWRASVPAVINLQAVTFALADLDRVPADEHALARDKAEMLITENADKLRRAWEGVARSLELEEIIAEAQKALRARVS